MIQWKLQNKGYCPFCTEPNENIEHILGCNHPDALCGWTESYHQYLQNLRKIGTCHTVILALKEEMYAWKFSRPPDTNNYHPLLMKVIHEQRSIGWRQFAEGLISPFWAQYMSHYFTKRKDKRTGKSWASKLITYSVKFLYALWDLRNQQLHNTDRIKDMQGLPHLQSSIRREWSIGIGRLPASEYSKFFTMEISDILNKPFEWQQTRFQIIRQARILMDTSHLITDEFTTSSVLQKWIGILYMINDSKAIPLLHQSIKMELQLGIRNLPPEMYQIYFTIDSQQILQQHSLDELKSWLINIRQGRERFGSS